MKTLQRPAAPQGFHINPHSLILTGDRTLNTPSDDCPGCSLSAAERLGVGLNCFVLPRLLTFVAVSNRVEVHVILLIGEEKEAEPGIEGVDRDYEENPHYVSLLVWRAVVTQVHVDLK